MEYLDFDIEVAPRDSGGYDVTVVDSPAGEARAEMRFPYDQLALKNRIQALQIALLRSGGLRRTATAEDRAVEELGRDLYGALFAGEIGSRLQVSRTIARREGRGIRIKLRLTAPELLGLPWEYLYDANSGDYLALAVSTPVIRYLPVAQPIQPLEVKPPLRILAMTAGPRDLGDLDVERERQRLEMALDRLQKRGLVELEWVAGETWEDLQEALWRGPWHVFHFVGHGGFDERRGAGVLYLTGPDGRARELSAHDLARLLGDHDPLRLAILNSCETAQGGQTDVFSSTATALVRRGTPAVVAMQFEITDDAAIQFSRVFYAATAHGMPVDSAVAEARKSVALQVANTYEWGTPVLFMRSPDGVLFRVPHVDEPAEAIDAAVAAVAVPPDQAVVVEADVEPEAPAAEPQATEELLVDDSNANAAPPVAAVAAPAPAAEPAPSAAPPVAAPAPPATAPAPPPTTKPTPTPATPGRADEPAPTPAIAPLVAPVPVPAQPSAEPPPAAPPAQPTTPPPQAAAPPPQAAAPPPQAAAPPPQTAYPPPPPPPVFDPVVPNLSGYPWAGGPTAKQAGGSHTRRNVFVGLGVLGIFGLLVAAVFASRPQTYYPSIDLDPDRGAPGTSFEVVGNGFPAAESISLTWADNSPLGSAFADGTGAFRGEFTVPARARAGVREVYASAFSGWSADASFQVVRGDAVDTEPADTPPPPDPAPELTTAVCDFQQAAGLMLASAGAIYNAIQSGFGAQQADIDLYYQTVDEMKQHLEVMGQWPELADFASRYSQALDDSKATLETWYSDPTSADAQQAADAAAENIASLNTELGYLQANYPEMGTPCW